MNTIRKQITLDQLVALNHEIASLCDAGIPLEQGLSQAAIQMQGNKQKAANRLAKAMEAGATLEQAIEAEGDQLPKIYRSFVRAGIQSGQLGKVLESLSEVTSRVASMRQVIFLAGLYPFVLFSITWGIIVFASRALLPEYEWIDIGSYARLSGWSDWLFGTWGLEKLLPLILFLVGMLCWWQTNPMRANSKFRMISYDRIPFLGHVYRLSAQACFADLLRLLLQQRVPLNQALPLAADATGYANLQTICQRASTDLKQGKLPTNLPPLVRLALSASHTIEHTDDTLRLIANAYRQQANSVLQNFSTFLPIFATGVLGGSVVLAFAVMMFYPYVESLKSMSVWY